jgi:hypothetical protein
MEDGQAERYGALPYRAQIVIVFAAYVKKVTQRSVVCFGATKSDALWGAAGDGPSGIDSLTDKNKISHLKRDA